MAHLELSFRHMDSWQKDSIVAFGLLVAMEGRAFLQEGSYSSGSLLLLGVFLCRWKLHLGVCLFICLLACFLWPRSNSNHCVDKQATILSPPPFALSMVLFQDTSICANIQISTYTTSWRNRMVENSQRKFCQIDSLFFFLIKEGTKIRERKNFLWFLLSVVRIVETCLAVRHTFPPHSTYGKLNDHQETKVLMLPSKYPKKAMAECF